MYVHVCCCNLQFTRSFPTLDSFPGTLEKLEKNVNRPGNEATPTCNLVFCLTHRRKGSGDVNKSNAPELESDPTIVYSNRPNNVVARKSISTVCATQSDVMSFKPSCKQACAYITKFQHFHKANDLGLCHIKDPFLCGLDFDMELMKYLQVGDTE